MLAPVVELLHPRRNRDATARDGYFTHEALHLVETAAREPCGHAGEGVRCWIDGRIDNTADLLRRFDPEGDPRPAFLFARAHARGLLEQVLQAADGDFFAVVHDAPARRLFLCNDRLGLRPAYFAEAAPGFLFCTRLRGFAAFPGFAPRISPDALECFLDLGHFVGDLTWFEGVRQLAPATLLEVDTVDGKIRAARRYWTWERIGRRSIGLEAAAEELGDLLRDAVARRILPGERVAILLSGGLDSRAILACTLPEQCAGTATFGQPGCRDLLYAERVARAAGVPHRALPLTEHEWFLNRLHAVWKTDGMSGPADLQGSRFLGDLLAISPVNLNGFAGDLVAGGSYLDPARLDTPPDAAFAASRYGRHARWSDPADAYFRSPRTDPYILANRVRRLTVSGTLEVEDAMEQRKPFMDTRLLEFLYSLPEAHRLHGRVYLRAMLRLRPDLFARVPWQKTGLSPRFGDGFPVRAYCAVFRRLQRLGWPSAPTELADFPRWIAASPGPFGTLLEDPRALWRDLAPARLHHHFQWRAHPSAAQARLQLQAAGVEAWFRQLFNGTHRDPEVSEAPPA